MSGSERLLSILGPGGRLSEVFDAYEPRAPQGQMAAHVEAALAKGRALVVEAGTGTGKTLAYLVPAAQSGLKVVVSTATKNLQEQLRDKDVPLLSTLGLVTKVAFLKGRQNYLCLLRKERFDAAPTLPVLDEFKLVPLVNAWARTTESGDRAELEGVPENAQLLKEITSTADTCTGQKCPHVDACFVFKARRAAADADVVVVNHHLFFADLALRSSSAGDLGAAVLPHYDAVIFDEAHSVLEAATQHFGAQVSSFRVQEFARDALRTLQAHPKRPAAKDLAQRLLSEGSAFFEGALECRPEEVRPAWKTQAPRGRKGAEPATAKDGEGSWALAPHTLWPAEQDRQGLVELLRALSSELSRKDPGPAEDEELQLLERRASALAVDLGLFASDPPPLHAADGEGPMEPPPAAWSEQDALPADAEDELVRWAEARAGHVFLHASPLDVARLLQDRLYDRIGPVVFASATLAVGGSLDYAARALGLRDEQGPLYPTDQAILESPFDFEKNAAVYLPARMPEPNDPGFADAVAAQVLSLCELTQGHAFALFTSLRNMRAVHALCAGPLRSEGLQVLLQGEGPKAQLLKAFKERPSVLFASQSFWEGVDVPGRALSLVVIDKLPFSSPQDPLTAARIERMRSRGQDAFNGWQLPQAALALKQGFGRLIRTATDRGIVALLDPRVTQKSYGRVFLSSLPKCRIVRTLDEAQDFWSGG